MSDKLSITTQRLRKLIDNHEKTRKDIATALDCDVSTITKHYNGDRVVNTDFIKRYARYFCVSADYLLGLSNVPSIDRDLQFICDYTGLNEKAIQNITVSNAIPVPLPLENRVFPVNISQYISGFDNLYFDIYESSINSLLSSDNLVNIITCCCIDKVLFVALDELREYYQKVKSNAVLTAKNKERISFLIHFTRNWIVQHKLSHYVAAENISEFMKDNSRFSKKIISAYDEAIQYFEEEIGIWKEGEAHGDDQEA
ncbi:MAG: helix-turn-helix transcriptional regulator [Ruminococcus sp.]|nr:helix-turn-helix transcriptional regulator [Ruminococcus sp.]